MNFSPSQQMKRILVTSLILPILDYASAAYSDLVVHSVTLQRALNTCVRYIYNLPIDTHDSTYYEQLQWLKVRERQKLSIAIAVFSVLKNKKPTQLSLLSSLKFKTTTKSIRETEGL